MTSLSLHSRPTSGPPEASRPTRDFLAETRTRRRISLISAGIGSLTSAMLLCGWGVRIGVEESIGSRDLSVIHQSSLATNWPRFDRSDPAADGRSFPTDWRLLRDRYDQLIRERSGLVVDADQAVREIDLTFATQIDSLHRLAEGKRAAANGDNALALVEFADQQDTLENVIERSTRMMDEVDDRAIDPQSESVQRQKWYIRSRYGRQVAELRVRMEKVLQEAEADVAHNRLQAAELVEACDRLERERRELMDTMKRNTRAELAALDEELGRVRIAMDVAYRRDATDSFARERQTGRPGASSLAAINRRAPEHFARIRDEVGGLRRFNRGDALADAGILNSMSPQR